MISNFARLLILVLGVWGWVPDSEALPIYAITSAAAWSMERTPVSTRISGDSGSS